MNSADQQLLEDIKSLGSARSMVSLRAKCQKLLNAVHASNQSTCFEDFGRDYLIAELEQIANARTLERAKYYQKRLHKSLTETKPAPYSDIDLLRWKQYSDLETGSLWKFETRDRHSEHTADYWGNFIPQIPNQLIRRFTKKNNWIIDGFAGSGTTLIEAADLGRNCLGVELQADRVKETRRLVNRANMEKKVKTVVRQGDSAAFDFSKELKKLGAATVQLVILHPPYHDIIQFSENEKDLSNCVDTDAFISNFCEVVRQSTAPLEKNRHLAVVIGDKYSGGEWIPLGFLTMQAVQNMGFKLKSIIVKNFEKTAGKRGQEELWHYRALAGGFYVFKHEYVFLFQKR